MVSNRKETEGLMKRYYHLFKTFKNWWIYIAHKYGFAVMEPLVFETRNGVIVEVPLGFSTLSKKFLWMNVILPVWNIPFLPARL